MGTIISSVGTLVRQTKTSQQRAIIHDGTRWWVFYFKSTSANTLFYAYSSNLLSWTESSTGLIAANNQDSGTLDILYDNNVVILSFLNDSGIPRTYLRGVISGTTITWGSELDVTNSALTFNASAERCNALVLQSDNKIIYAWDDQSGNIAFRRSTNVIGPTFSDVGANWIGLGGISLGNWIWRLKVLDISGSILAIWNDRSGGNDYLRWNKCLNSGTTWDGATNFFSATAGADGRQWDAVKVTATDVKLLCINATNTFAFYKHNGTSVSSSTAPSWPTNGLNVNSGLCLITDGTDIWAFIIRGDANKTLTYNKYTTSLDSWGGWVDIESTIDGTDVTATYSLVTNRIAILYTKSNGGNYDIVSSYLSFGPEGALIPIFLNQYKQRWI